AGAWGGVAGRESAGTAGRRAALEIDFLARSFLATTGAVHFIGIHAAARGGRAGFHAALLSQEGPRIEHYPVAFLQAGLDLDHLVVAAAELDVALAGLAVHDHEALAFRAH